MKFLAQFEIILCAASAAAASSGESEWFNDCFRINAMHRCEMNDLCLPNCTIGVISVDSPSSRRTFPVNCVSAHYYVSHCRRNLSLSDGKQFDFRPRVHLAKKIYEKSWNV